MFRRKCQPPARKRHPDARIELRLQQIFSLQRSAERQDLLAAEYRAQMASARMEQERAGEAFLKSAGNFDEMRYQAMMKAQQDRIAAAEAGLAAAEQAIAAAMEKISQLAEGLSDHDLACL